MLKTVWFPLLLILIWQGLASSEFLVRFDNHIVFPASLLPHKDADSFKFPEYSSAIETHEITSDYYTTLLRQDQTGMLLEANSSLTVAEKQKFTIQEISPEWGYETEATKVCIMSYHVFCAFSLDLLCFLSTVVLFPRLNIWFVYGIYDFSSI